ncbi:MAG: undecaprenyl-diphosphate phosphatase [Rhizobiales bacterium]|nr:undecaprenyl-diphosphate phosphatase [Hyphomicrobiales bacterium]MDQ3560468.1 undecaprenyl-diphosphate phosphatase [Pseudomonadota bacterium]
MNLQSIFDAILLGIVEGLTEFIPVSSTGHLLLTTWLLGLDNDPAAKAFWDTFNVLIQFGAILAVVVVYFGRLWRVLLALPSDPAARRFVASIVVAFLPSALVGVMAYDFIKGVLFNSPQLICIVLIVGGVLLALLDRLDIRPVHRDAMRFPLGVALAVGLFQCLAIVPGVSRSGATIAGALLMRSDKSAAAEFSFFLAIPTMLGAFVLDFYESREILFGANLGLIAIGFVVSFLSALVVVRTLVAFVARHGFMPFAVWRIIVGAVGLAVISTVG